MTKAITIRPAGLADAPALEALFEALDEHHRRALPHVFRKPPAARREATWLEERLAGADSAILIAEGIGGKALGLAVLTTRAVPATVMREARRFVEIEELVVDPELRHLGVGRSLIAAAQDWARQRGIPALEVSAWSFNLDTIAFYKRVGFEPTVARFAMAAE